MTQYGILKPPGTWGRQLDLKMIWDHIWGSTTSLGYCQCCSMIIYRDLDYIPVERECLATLCQSCSQRIGSMTFKQYAQRYALGDPMDIS